MRWLLDHGADLEAIAFGIPPAVWFAAGGFQVLLGGARCNTPDQVARLRLLLEVGPSPQEMADQGRSLLMAACEVEDPARVTLLPWAIPMPPVQSVFIAPVMAAITRPSTLCYSMGRSLTRWAPAALPP